MSCDPPPLHTALDTMSHTLSCSSTEYREGVWRLRSWDTDSRTIDIRLHTVHTTFLSNITSDCAAGLHTAAATLLLHLQCRGRSRGWAEVGGDSGGCLACVSTQPCPHPRYTGSILPPDTRPDHTYTLVMPLLHPCWRLVVNTNTSYITCAIEAAAPVLTLPLIARDNETNSA